MSSSEDRIAYGWKDSFPTPIHKDLIPVLTRLISTAKAERGAKTLLDLGCGNGAVDGSLLPLGLSITGVDASPDGLQFARDLYPTIRYELGSVYEDLSARFGTFDVVVSLDVVEHLYDPRSFVRNLRGLISPGGIAILSTPYHGYLKNLALAVSGNFDKHFTALWDHGHIKFWSRSTLGTLLDEANLSNVEFLRVGRIPSLAKSLVAVVRT